MVYGHDLSDFVEDVDSLRNDSMSEAELQAVVGDYSGVRVVGLPFRRLTRN